MQKILSLLRLVLPFLFWWSPEKEKEKAEQAEPEPSPVPSIEDAIRRAKETSNDLDSISETQARREEAVRTEEVHRATPGLAVNAGLDPLELLDPWPDPSETL